MTLEISPLDEEKKIFVPPNLNDLQQSVMDEQIARMENCYFVRHEAHDKPIKFVMQDYHKEILHRRYAGYKRQIVIKGRQVYCTTFFCVLMFDICVFRPESRCVINNMTEQDMVRTIEDKIHYTAKYSPWLSDHINLKTKLTKDGVEFDNGSSIKMTRSGRSHTSTMTLITEAAFSADTDPDKFNEVIQGSLNGSQNFPIFLETSPYGNDNKFIDMVRTSVKRERAGRIRTMDFPVMFIPWWKKKANLVNQDDAERTEINPFFEAYFDKVEQTENTKLSLRQKAWYLGKLEVDSQENILVQRAEHPSTLEEALSHHSESFILQKQMTKAKEDGRCKQLPDDESKPSVVTWDFGSGRSATAFQVWQKEGDFYHMVYAYEKNQAPLSHYLHMLSAMNYNVMTHFLPHDATHKNYVNQKLVGTVDTSIETAMRQAGYHNLIVIPRVMNKKAGFDASIRFCKHVRFCGVHANAAIIALNGVQRKYDEKGDRLFDKLKEKGKASEYNHLYDAFELAARAWESNLLFPHEGYDPVAEMEMSQAK